ncbi:MAG TPA: ribonuclease HII [Bacteroidales bacterium]|nr:ribonuclease HII [Bacteroidales bacterium]HOK74074.1 ribonuclease HII [Bacteroidales bacterium]HOM40308.1 ribonuclease HII [Bacteroidales bacterium]HPP92401.1 ribonuclease HII [Bacteroidales bacterium]
MLKPYLYRNLQEAGCDEAGRGCLAGPVVAAAVILPKKYRNPLINDSKKLSSKTRALLKDEITSVALAWNVAFVDNNEIDRTNIMRAAIKAMHLALDGLSQKPEFILVDGNVFYPYRNIKHETVVHGDSLFMSIASASILAKVFRDEYMMKIHEEFPVYGWNRNKGYATSYHRNAILKYGISPYHRKSFNLFERQLKIDF